MVIGQASSAIGEVRGRGLMWGLELVKDRESREPLGGPEIGRHMGDLATFGLLLTRHENVLGLLPPLVLSEPVIEELLGMLREGLATTWNGRMGRHGRLMKRKTRKFLADLSKKLPPPTAPPDQ